MTALIRRVLSALKLGRFPKTNGVHRLEGETRPVSGWMVGNPPAGRRFTPGRAQVPHPEAREFPPAAAMPRARTGDVMPAPVDLTNVDEPQNRGRFQ